MATGRVSLVALASMLTIWCYNIEAQMRLDTSLIPSGYLEVTRESPFCQFEDTIGAFCNYNATKEEVVIPDGFKLPNKLLIVNIYNAYALRIFPACVLWIHVKDTQFLTTLSVSDKDSGDDHNCRTWLRIERSNADTISYGVSALNMYNSTANTISLVDMEYFLADSCTIDTIENLHWHSAKSSIHNTTVGVVYKMTAEDDFSVLHSRLMMIAANGIVFESRAMDVVDTFIGHMAKDGLRIKRGKVTFVNVTIDRMDVSAITLVSPEALLVFRNVTILSAAVKSIVLLDVDSIRVEQSTVGGEKLKLTSPYFIFLDDSIFPENSTEIFIEEMMNRCYSNSTESTLICEFRGVDEVIGVRADAMKSYQVVQIKDARFLRIHSTVCNLELKLISVNGTLPHFVTEEAFNSSGTKMDVCDMSLTTFDSKLGVVCGKYINNITLDHTSLGRLHEGSINTLEVHNATVDIIDSVKITGTGNKWVDLEVKSFHNVTLEGPVRTDGFVVRGKMNGGALIIDHPNETTEISGGLFTNVMSDAIRVKNGSTLILKDVNVEFLHEESIYVEEGGFLHLELFKPGIFSYGFISVANMSQVTIRDSFNGGITGVMQIRQPVVHANSTITIANPLESPFCKSKRFFALMCDFSTVQNASVAVEIVGRQHNDKEIVIRNATTLTIYPSCIQKVYLSNITEATTVDIESNCTTSLDANKVQFKNIISGVSELFLASCKVNKINLYKELQGMKLVHTHVKDITALSWTRYSGIIQDSLLDSVEGITALSQMVAHNMTISSIKSHGVTLLSGGHLDNCIIGEVASGGITVIGTLRLENVTIKRLHEEAVIVEDGILILKNVTINSADDKSIVAKPSGGVAMEDVIVAGKKVLWHGYIVDNFSADDSSVVFLNKPYGDDQNDSKQIPLPPVHPKQFTPFLTTTTLMPATSFAPAMAAIPGKDAKTQSQSPWKVVSVILIVMLVLILIICIFGAVKFSRSKRTGVTPEISFQVREDNQHLLDDSNSLNSVVLSQCSQPQGVGSEVS